MTHPAFIDVRLEVPSGALVTRGMMPRWMPGKEPAVIVWGSRHFLRHEVDGDIHVYRECFAYALVEPFIER